MEDIDWTFRRVCEQSDRPAYARILDIQQSGYSSTGKALIWRFLEKGRKRQHNIDDEKIKLHYVQAQKGYIAVSCPWWLPDYEKNTTGKYRVTKDFDIKIKIPQDVVLDRVTKFAATEECPFWIDKLCINQAEDSDEKQIAIQSMDLVYKQSKVSLGLLFVRLDCKEQVRRLGTLLCGKCAAQKADRRSNAKYVLTTDAKEAKEVLNIIDLIVKDNWWTRAWIFQEEYLSSLRMKLLIRSSQYHTQTQFPKFGVIPGELQVQAANFRTEATVFCLAFLRQSGISEDYRSRIAEILKRAGKYSILLTQNNLVRTLEAMSLVIFDDIGRRNITDVWDILAIACNCCDYSKRLDTRKLQQQQWKDGSSLSLAILTTYILNGEILRHDWTSGEYFNGNIFDFLKQNTIKIDPPLGKEKGLTFIKHCRFPDVVLFSYGMETTGIIWKLGVEINLPHWFVRQSAPQWLRKKIKKYYPWKPSGFRYRLDNHEYEALWRLVDWLRNGEKRSYEALASSLSDFLEDIAPEGYDDDWTCRHIMSMMAVSVARAVQENKPLRLGCIDSGKRSSYSAIFITDTTYSRDNKSYVFTSWTCAEDIAEQDFLVTSCAKYASLEIEPPTPKNHPPMIKPLQWINGLCFFSNKHARRVIVPWPRSIAG
jgi:hypothetical protein